MNIGIVGGGAIGLLFAFYLSERHSITVYTNRSEQAEVIKDKGVRMIRGETTLLRKMKAKPATDGISDEDLLIITVKQYHLPSILPALYHFKGNLLFVQNGMSHIDQVKLLPAKEIIFGVVEHGALIHNQNTVEHSGIGVTKLASLKNPGRDLLADDIPFFSFQIEPDYYNMLLKKLVVNAVINPLTALLRVENGYLVKHDQFYNAFLLLFNEIAEVLELSDREGMQRHVEDICRTTSKNRSSMLKDIEKGRQTEIDAILGFVLSQAKEKSKNAKIAAMLYMLIKGKEQQGEESL
ncbi:2-dehydropantoate 2-reductase [Peribacillus saganii]|uniref:2-dehydropantoate 2-reductase n=1 Tax=Peribacillus saganii TaxID=2303992 RepID=A0A372LSY4_9BACI|nr:2-dehydropantoate 2-reductase [Peribacillus saganii]RFU71166.1 2-dehydropantoate 2-reductase [Peribacillus saganii]